MIEVFMKLTRGEERGFKSISVEFTSQNEVRELIDFLHRHYDGDITPLTLEIELKEALNDN